MRKMKLNFALVNLAVSSGLLFSCQPKDITLNPKGTNANNASVSTLSSTDSDKMLALSLDRQAESLHLLKAVMNPAYAEAHGLEIVDGTLRSKNGKVILDAPTRSSQYVINYQIKKMDLDAKGKLISLLLKNKAGVVSESKGFIKSTTPGGKPTDFSIKAMTEFISIDLSANENEYAIEIDRVDETNSKADGKTTLELDMSSSVQWDGTESTLDKDLSVKLLTLSTERRGSKAGSLKYETIESNLTVKLDDCTSVNGTIKLTQKIDVTDANGKMTIPKFISSSVVITDSSMSVSERGFASAAQACETRPVVDLTKML